MSRRLPVGFTFGEVGRMSKTYRLSGEGHGANRDSLRSRRRAMLRRQIRREMRDVRENGRPFIPWKEQLAR